MPGIFNGAAPSTLLVVPMTFHRQDPPHRARAFVVSPPLRTRHKQKAGGVFLLRIRALTGRPAETQSINRVEIRIP